MHHTAVVYQLFLSYDYEDYLDQSEQTRCIDAKGSMCVEPLHSRMIQALRQYDLNFPLSLLPRFLVI